MYDAIRATGVWHVPAEMEDSFPSCRLGVGQLSKLS
jgi:hypothetical protein